MKSFWGSEDQKESSRTRKSWINILFSTLRGYRVDLFLTILFFSTKTNSFISDQILPYQKHAMKNSTSDLSPLLHFILFWFPSTTLLYTVSILPWNCPNLPFMLWSMVDRSFRRLRLICKKTSGGNTMLLRYNTVSSLISTNQMHAFWHRFWNLSLCLFDLQRRILASFLYNHFSLFYKDV